MTAKFPYKGRILMIGYGSVGRCTMPMIERHFDMPMNRITIVDAVDNSADAARFIAQGLNYVVNPLVQGNLAKTLAKYVGKGDLILNLTVEVSSHALVEWCAKNGVHYHETCNEP